MGADQARAIVENGNRRPLIRRCMGIIWAWWLHRSGLFGSLLSSSAAAPYARQRMRICSHGYSSILRKTVNVDGKSMENQRAHSPDSDDAHVLRVGSVAVETHGIRRRTRDADIETLNARRSRALRMTACPFTLRSPDAQYLMLSHGQHG